MNKKYPVYCAWCLKKGIKKIVEYSSTSGSHGICDECHKEVMRQIEEDKNKKDDENENN